MSGAWLAEPAPPNGRERVVLMSDCNDKRKWEKAADLCSLDAWNGGMGDRDRRLAVSDAITASRLSVGVGDYFCARVEEFAVERPPR